MTRLPDLETIEKRPDGDGPEPAGDALGYWSTRDSWADLGRRIGALKIEAKKRGVPLEDMPGAPGLIARFKQLGREVDRGAR